MSMQRADNDILAEFGDIVCLAYGFGCSQVLVFGYLLCQDVFLRTKNTGSVDYSRHWASHIENACSVRV